MKNILCFGDSNTYGYNPENKTRYDWNTRWTGRLQQLLGNDYRIIEEDCNSRTTFADDFVLPYNNARDYIVPCLISHTPLDLIIICLGTNDLKFRFNLTPLNVRKSMKALINIVRTTDYGTFGKAPKVLLMSPIRIDDEVENKKYANYNKESAKKSHELAVEYEDLAKEIDCYFFDAGSVAKASKKDYVHLTPEGHKAIADALFAKVKEIFE